MVEALTYVFNRSEARKFDRLVLLTIANFLNKETFTAWPAISTLAEDAGISESRVKDSLQSLVQIGEIAIEERRSGEVNLSNVYRMPLFQEWFESYCKRGSYGNPVGRSTAHPPPQGDPGVGRSATQGGPQGTYDPVIEPVKEEPLNEPAESVCSACGEVGIHRCPGRPRKPPKPNKPRRSSKEEPIRIDNFPSAPPTWDASGFEQFWANYPVQVGRQDAQKAWNEKQPVAAAVMEGLAHWKLTDRWQSAGGKYIPAAWRFIDKETWKEDPTPRLERDLSYGYPRLDTKQG